MEKKLKSVFRALLFSAVTIATYGAAVKSESVVLQCITLVLIYAVVILSIVSEAVRS